MYCVKFKICVTGGLCYLLKYNVDVLNIKWKVISRGKETIMKKKEGSFCKKFSWFLLILGLSLILVCQSWSQIRVSGLGCDTNHLL